MNTPVIAIGLDGADPVLIENWMSQGHLKNLCRLRQQGAYGRLTNAECYQTETPWTTFLTGCLPHQTGYWTPIKFQEGTYNLKLIGAYNFQEHPPFYLLGENYRVAVFDILQAHLGELVNKDAVLRGSNSFSPRLSYFYPEQLLTHLASQPEELSAFPEEQGVWWDQVYLTRLQQSLNTSINRRAAHCRDLLRQQKWDLFLTSFSETYSAIKNFWFLSQPEHPLYHHHRLESFTGDPMLAVFESVDRAIAKILAEVPKNAYVLVFSVNGSGSNNTDLPSMLFLPEFLYRFSFPGKSMLPNSSQGTAPLPPVSSLQKTSWQAAIWRQMYDPNPLKYWLRRWGPDKLNQSLNQLCKPVELAGSEKNRSLSWCETQGFLSGQPAMWYRPFWPEMKAFALPSCSEGYIRINLQGREPEGIVKPSEYEALCEEITQHLHHLKNGRTGTPVVKKVLRTRKYATECHPKLPDADLVVIWQEVTGDVIESPHWGRFGPVPYFHSGNCRAGGFFSALGPGIEAGSGLASSHTINLTPTILELMGVPIPEYYEGKPLISRSETHHC
ncbi:alkaline phosphatase family protein [Lyngbya aestuarii]|uniref:alkaline phosphatase family protein n=1 Tax=Lyngbya aestuarii TaxID=118322 RepID=UPI00403DA055